ncbi:AMSH-like ubiquitin thioesterase 3 [Amborella trichopoda]|uniref:MPN domain-containing protein n=1 Tax=Amborella trichopoda TaxID=13333 RepID=W1PHV5_AMBTC|nr:AMSH-like ubiquitin thioesterase 3 [Amborella trichopoda]ERN06665.1 hypothetical protein AMTR_s00058p00193370 [Amborella trichopoda]|eukprot:XP_006844990.1 AMSH-like ubiquitin thioesterase 3 [Amborella trichopoda]
MVNEKAVFDILSSEQKVDVDNRLPLAYYYRIASHMINQAKIYREENNIIDLYIILLRFSSLVSVTIPQHQQYPTYSGKDKLHCKKILRDFISELENLKPIVQEKFNEINKQCGGHNQKMPHSEVYGDKKSRMPHKLHEGKHLLPNPVQEQLKKFSLGTICPSEDTLARHSYLGGLQSQQESLYSRANYPSSPRFKDNYRSPDGESISTQISTGDIGLASVVEVYPSTTRMPFDSPSTSVRTGDCDINVHIVRQPYPSPVLACTQYLSHEWSTFQYASHVPIAKSRDRLPSPFGEDSSGTKGIQNVHISTRLMEDFLELARVNTSKNLETCGVLGASLKNRTFYVTSLIIPKQESTSDSCQTLNEEELYAVQDEKSLFPLGWIHTHPSQSCFMSSIDLHTHYSYQIMLPEAIAIVMAPTDTERSYGIFRLADPEGVGVLKECQQRGFHVHEGPSDGSPIYEHCSHVYMNPNLRFEIIDLR